MSAADKDMNTKRFRQIDRWLTRTLRYDSTMPLTVDELYRRARNIEYGKQELLWVASTATKSIPHGPSMYRFVVDRNETGIFVGLNDKSEQYHWTKRQRRGKEEPYPDDESEYVHPKRRRCKEEPYH